MSVLHYKISEEDSTPSVASMSTLSGSGGHKQVIENGGGGQKCSILSMKIWYQKIWGVVAIHLTSLNGSILQATISEVDVR